MRDPMPKKEGYYWATYEGRRIVVQFRLITVKEGRKSTVRISPFAETTGQFSPIRYDKLTDRSKRIPDPQRKP